MGAYDIDYFNLILGYSILLIPMIVLGYYRTGLVKASFIAVARMTIQLLLIGVYLEYLFKLNNVWINLLWAFLMIVVTAFTIIKKSNLHAKYFLLPVLIAILFSISIVDTFFLGIVIKHEYLFEARYFIPITGMLLGNCLQTNIIAMNSFFEKLHKNKVLYQFYLGNGSSEKEALVPFIRTALQNSFNPLIANIGVIGLISLPGMMTGQILGGSNPSVAIKYQIMLMITIFVTSILTVILSIMLSVKWVFDDFNNLKINIFKNG